MTNTVTPYYNGPEDDGFRRGSFNSGRLIKGSLIGWNDIKHWADRDGSTPPSPMLVIKVNEVLQRWQDNLPEVIDTKPLPDPEELNKDIPVAEWEIGLDDKPRPPWAHTVVVYFVNLSTGEFYTYTSATYGGHLAFEQLNDAVLAMRMLRGEKVMPLVELGEKPFKTKRGMKTRPHFQIVDWKTPGGSAALPAEPMTLLPNPDAPSAPKTEAEQPRGNGKGKPRMKSRVRLAEETLGRMGDVKPAEAGEVIDDDIPF
jgi:hypothetical protein